MLCYDSLRSQLSVTVESPSSRHVHRNNGMKEQCSIDARHQLFFNRVVNIWNSLPAAVVLSPSVAVCKRNLAKLTFSSFLRYN